MCSSNQPDRDVPDRARAFATSLANLHEHCKTTCFRVVHEHPMWSEAAEGAKTCAQHTLECRQDPNHHDSRIPNVGPLRKTLLGL